MFQFLDKVKRPKSSMHQNKAVDTCTHCVPIFWSASELIPMDNNDDGGVDAEELAKHDLTVTERQGELSF